MISSYVWMWKLSVVQCVTLTITCCELSFGSDGSALGLSNENYGGLMFQV